MALLLAIQPHAFRVRASSFGSRGGDPRLCREMSNTFGLACRQPSHDDVLLPGAQWVLPPKFAAATSRAGPGGVACRADVGKAAAHGRPWQGRPGTTKAAAR